MTALKANSQSIQMKEYKTSPYPHRSVWSELQSPTLWHDTFVKCCLLAVILHYAPSWINWFKAQCHAKLLCSNLNFIHHIKNVSCWNRAFTHLDNQSKPSEMSCHSLFSPPSSLTYFLWHYAEPPDRHHRTRQPPLLNQTRTWFQTRRAKTTKSQAGTRQVLVTLLVWAEKKVRNRKGPDNQVT